MKQLIKTSAMNLAAEIPPIQQDIKPAFYTNVKEFCDWIEGTTKREAKCQKETVTLKDVDIY